MQTEKLMLAVLVVSGGVMNTLVAVPTIPLPHFEYVMNATPAPLAMSEKALRVIFQKLGYANPDDVRNLERAKVALTIKTQEKELLARHQDLLVQSRDILNPSEQETRKKLDAQLKENSEKIDHNGKEIARLENNTIPLLSRRITTLVRARSAEINQAK